MVIKINYTSSDVYVSTSVSPVYVVVNYSAVNNGSSVAWGAITGTLSNQTDLQNALNAKVPYSGATGQVDLGNYDLKVQGLTIDRILMEEINMSSKEIQDKVKKIIAEKLSVDLAEVKPEASFVDDLGADSLDLVELIMSMEEEFGVDISDEDAEKILTVKDAMDYVAKRQ